MKVCVVIPAYNEGKRIVVVLQRLIDNGFEVIVVNDGSKDETAEVIGRLPVIYTEHLVNQGQGAALRTGTMLARKLGFDAVAHFDADGQHREEDLIRAIQTLETENLDIVLTSRFLDSSTELPGKKKIVLNLAKLFSRVFLKINFSDPQSGLRVINLNAFPKLEWQKDDFQHCTEILSLVTKNNLRYVEIPVTINYDEYSVSKETRPRLSMGWKLLLSKIIGKL